MNRQDLPRVDSETPNQREELIARLKASVPEAFSDGKLDVEALQTLLGDKVEDGPERFTFTWAGKRDAMAMLQAPSSATLAPDPENSINFDESQHVFIEGENLEVLKVLYRSYFGRVKLIYIDPPYNTGKEFIYPDNFADPLDHYLKLTGQRTEDGDDTTSKTETAGRLHSGWLSMMYPRLSLARQFLAEDGLIFVSIDDHEAPNLRRLMELVFGEENFFAQLVWKKAYGGGAKAKHIVGHHEYIMCFAKSKAAITKIDLPPNPETRKYYRFKDEKFEKLGPYRTQPLWTNSMDDRENLRYPITHEDEEIWPEKQWQWSRERVEQAQKDNELEFLKGDDGWSVYYKQYLYDENGDERAAKLYSLQDGPYTQKGTDELEEIFGDENGKVFPFPKPSTLLKKLISSVWRSQEAIIMDFFAGSGSTAQAVLSLEGEGFPAKLKFLTVQMAEQAEDGTRAAALGYKTIPDITRDRIKWNVDKHGAVGFRAFRLQPSNLKKWSGVEAKDPDTYAAQLEAFTDSLAPGWQLQDVIWEVALREGYSLTAKVEELDMGSGPTFWRVSDEDRSFTICLDEALSLDAVAPLGLTKDDMFVCRDTALDDTLAANLALQCRLKVI
ncbi:site-specific DNA-methyltransferase [Nitratireductor aquimarinus]|uniref:site-specific DNA-methyltransferase n=1 Tax=Nitratireductor aquimarinus TaxID=889300 RepID=UPI0029362A90|nr:site-specific DNA-methyltransferase [Nitratireductor aquimarinus]MDV2968609.1 site-specific DNA-methyltransferase [Nitratireductor aquimarinus]